MSSIKVTINIELDAITLPGYPVIRRLEVDENQQFKYEKTSGGGFSALPLDQLGEIQALLLESDQQITLRLDGQSDAGIVLNPGGLIFLMDVDIDAGAGASNASVENASGSTANIKGIGAGT
jgi:hypothetical protein